MKKRTVQKEFSRGPVVFMTQIPRVSISANIKYTLVRIDYITSRRCRGVKTLRVLFVYKNTMRFSWQKAIFISIENNKHLKQRKNVEM